MTDRKELRRLAQAMTGWRDCNKAWLDTSEDVAAAVVGHIDEDGNTYPVVTVDCEQYYSGDSLALAKFYAAANPAAVLELLDDIEAMRKQEPAYWGPRNAVKNRWDSLVVRSTPAGPEDVPLYLAPGAQGVPTNQTVWGI